MAHMAMQPCLWPPLPAKQPATPFRPQLLPCLPPADVRPSMNGCTGAAPGPRQHPRSSFSRPRINPLDQGFYLPWPFRPQQQPRPSPQKNRYSTKDTTSSSDQSSSSSSSSSTYARWRSSTATSSAADAAAKESSTTSTTSSTTPATGSTTTSSSNGTTTAPWRSSSSTNNSSTTASNGSSSSTTSAATTTPATAAAATTSSSSAAAGDKGSSKEAAAKAASAASTETSKKDAKDATTSAASGTASDGKEPEGGQQEGGAAHPAAGTAPVLDASRFVGLVTVPVVVWCLTWVLTSGAVDVAGSCLTGMRSLAALLFPTVPVKGADHEDVAFTLVKMLATGTDVTHTWRREGLGLPGWLLRGCMVAMYKMVTACSSLAGSTWSLPGLPLLAGLSTACLYLASLLLVLPAGRWAVQAAQRAAPSLTLPQLPPSTSLAVQLVGLLAWPCISLAGVVRALHSASPATAGLATPAFAPAMAQVGATLLAVALVAAMGLAAGAFGVSVMRGGLEEGQVVDWGLTVGVLCAAQLGINLLHMLLAPAAGVGDPRGYVLALMSSAVTARLAWGIWTVSRKQAPPATPEQWLEALSWGDLPRLVPAGATGGAEGEGAGEEGIKEDAAAASATATAADGKAAGADKEGGKDTKPKSS